jgi:hypothetical protein
VEEGGFGALSGALGVLEPFGRTGSSFHRGNPINTKRRGYSRAFLFSC